MSFHLFYWGGILNDGVAADFLKTDSQDFWFDTSIERDDFKSRLQGFAKLHNRVVCFTENEGEAAEKRTVAVMLFEFSGKHYPLEYDFGVGYPADSAEFMWEEGRYSCDGNRSIFLSERYPEVFTKDRDCGDEIDMIDFKVEYRAARNKDA